MTKRRLFGFLLVSQIMTGCQWLSEVAYPDKGDIEIRVRGAKNINPNSIGIAQPVKICVMEITNRHWTPPHYYEGLPCQKLQINQHVLRLEQAILWPSQENRYFFSVSFRDATWLMIGAEFQTLNGANLLIKQNIQVKPKTIVNVIVSGNQLFFDNK